MAYRCTKKRNKIWSEQAAAEKARLRIENAEPRPLDDEVYHY